MNNEENEVTTINVDSPNFKNDFSQYANHERVSLFDDFMGTGESTITCIYGPYRSGKSTLVQDISNCCKDAIILDADALHYHVFNDNKLVIASSTESENFMTQMAVTMAKLAYYFASHGRNVIVDGVNADVVFKYLHNTLTDIASRKARVTKNRYIPGVKITLRKIATEEIETFDK